MGQQNLMAKLIQTRFHNRNCFYKETNNKRKEKSFIIIKISFQYNFKHLFDSHNM